MFNKNVVKRLDLVESIVIGHQKLLTTHGDSMIDSTQGILLVCDGLKKQLDILRKQLNEIMATVKDK